MRSESEWTEIIKRQRGSGISQPKFCQREGIAQSTFDRWYHRLGDKIGGPKLVEMTMPVISKEAVEIEFPSGIVLRIRG